MLYECHGHIILDGISYSDSISRHKNGVNEEFVRNNLKICAEHGIKFYRDGGDKHMVSALAKKIAPEYGIDYRTPVYIIHKKGFYGSMFGRAFTDLPEYTALVLEAKRLGADFIKIAVSGILDFSSSGAITGSALTYHELCEMIKIASSEGFPVMAHANGAGNIINALMAGAASIEHGFHMNSEAISALRSTGAVWVPTCATVANLIGTGRFQVDVLREILDTHRSSILEASEKGALIAAGSDAGAFGVLQARGTSDEYEFLNTLGVPFDEGNREIAQRFRRHTAG